MPLPNPDYLTNEYFNWDESQFPAVLVDGDLGSPTLGTKRNIRWDHCDVIDRIRVHDLIMGYIERSTPIGSPLVTLTESNALTDFSPQPAYQTINYNGLVVGANATGLVVGVDYVFSVTLNGVTTTYTINGTGADTFTNLVAEMNTALPGTLVASIFDGNIEIATVATGAGESISARAGTLFENTSGYINMAEARVGVTTVGDIFDLNYRDGYQTYASLLIGKLRNIPDKTPATARTQYDVYFNHATASWLYVYSDGTPV